MTRLRNLALGLAVAVLPAPGTAAVMPFPTGFHVQDVTVPGVRIHVRVGGHGPASVLIHGLGDIGDMWAPPAARMAPPQP